jgi:alpha-glucosidase
MIQRVRCSGLLLLLLMFLTPRGHAHQQVLSIESPDNIHTVVFTLNDGVPEYAVYRLGNQIVAPSRLGFALREDPEFDRGFTLDGHDISDSDETWEQVWGEKRFIRNHYRELKVDLVRALPGSRSGARQNGSGPNTGEPALAKMSIIFRAYDDGVAFRYEIPSQPAFSRIHVMDERTEFAFTGDYTAWYIDAYQWNRFEYLTRTARVSEIDTVHTPLTLRSDDGLYLSIHEAALVDYSTMTLERVANDNGVTLKANLMPWADGVLVRTGTPMVTPWRTLQLADVSGDLITSHLILNLNEPNKLEDVSWIEPAKYIGIWWEMHLDKSTWGVGPNHGATTENAIRYIDFAAEHGFPHVLIEGWNVGWDENWFEEGAVFSFTEPAAGFDLEKVFGHARDKGVRIMGHHENSASVLHYEDQMEDAFALYEDLGVRAVKTGYVGHGREIIWHDGDGNPMREWHHGQFMVNHHQRVVELAASHRISLNVHEGVKDTGLRRTWPNLMTREVARGQEYNAWGDAEDLWDEGRGNPPDHVAYLPFTRMLSGPFDYTPGIVDLHYDTYRPDNRVNHTLAKELALYVVLYSPLHMAADLPENYEAHPEPFRFIKEVPTDWYDTKVLHADVGNYVTIVRKDRNSEDWYLGSISDEHGRVLTTPLHFLDPGKQYLAQIYRDGPDADWFENPYDMEVVEKQVDHRTKLTLRLAAGGGQAIRFTPVP